VGVLCLIGLAACGGISENATVLRIGDQQINKATVDHWTRVIERGGAFSGFRGAPKGGTPKQRALILLISSSWLIGEAERQGVPVSEAVVDKALAEREQGGGAALRKRLKQTGQTQADVKLELRAEVALEAVRAALAKRAARVTEGEVVGYYRNNGELFHTQDRRMVDIVSGLPSSEAASALAVRLGAGPRFARIATLTRVYRLPHSDRTPENAIAADAMFAARLGVVSHPVRFEHGWAVFFVRKEIPGVLKPLAEVRHEVLAQLDLRHQRELQPKFDAEYKAWWTARTSCKFDYVVAGCPQFQAELGPYEDPFSKRAHPLFSELGASG
jgi:hypothetical protein